MTAAGPASTRAATPAAAESTPAHRPVREPDLRHPRDVLRLAAGLVAFGVILAAVAAGQVGRFEGNLFRLVNGLPHPLGGLLLGVLQAGSLAAVALLAVLAIVLRRVRLARDLAVAGVAAWALSRGLQETGVRDVPAGLPGLDIHLPSFGHPGFPAAHVAVAAALAAVAWPYLGVRLRRLSLLVVAVVVVASIYSGVQLPWDAAGGAALGLAVGAVVHLVFGAPGGRPALPAVRQALDDAGLLVAEIHAPHLDARGSTPFFVRTRDRRELFVKAVGRTQRDADVLFKAWRYLLYRRPADEFPRMTPKQDVEHEAHLSMLAERAGVRTPSVILDAAMADGTMLLVQQRVLGRSLVTLDPSELTDSLLDDLWAQVARLHAVRIAHRDLRLANVLVSDDGRAWLIDFGTAEAAANRRRTSQDVAELLAATAVVAGPERTCRAACRHVGTAAVADALPLLQPLALTTETRRQVSAQPGLLDRLRAAAAATSGGTPPELERLPRLRWRTLILVVAGGVALYLFLPALAELSSVSEAVQGGSWPWVVAAAAASAAGYLAAAVALVAAAGRSLAVLPAVIAQLAASFANRFTPAGLGALAVNTRFLMRHGLDRTAAVTAVALTTASGVAVHVIALLIVVPLALGRAGALGSLRESVPSVAVLGAVAMGLVLAGAILLSPFGRRRLIPTAREALGNLGATLRRPGQALTIAGGSAGVTLSYIVALAATAQAFGLELSFLETSAAYLAGAALATAAPTPGGLGAAEAALSAGLIALGAGAGPAVATVLAFRLATFWLPILPGLLALRWLRRRGGL